MLHGSIQELDTRAYFSSAVYTWSLVDDEASVDKSGQIRPTDIPISDYVDVAVANMEAALQQGLKQAIKSGVHILGCPYYQFESFFKILPMCPSRYYAKPRCDPLICKLNAVAGAGSTHGLSKRLFAYGGTLGLIHLCPAIYMREGISKE